jgi:hypothetical protein
MVAVANFTNGRAAPGIHIAKLTRRHLQRGTTVLDRHELQTGAGAAGDLALRSQAPVSTQWSRVDGGMISNGKLFPTV